MSRSRNIRPEFFTDDKTASLSFGAQLLFIGTWTQSDLRGVYEHNARQLKARIFPCQETVTIDQVAKWLDEIVRAGLTETFAIKVTVYGYIRNFAKHQAISTNERKGGPKYPSPANGIPAESKPPAPQQTPESSPGQAVVMPESDQGTTKVVLGSALHRTEDGGHRTEDARDAPMRPSDRWPYEQMLPWSQRLVTALCKIGSKNWPSWKALCDRYGHDRVAEVAEGIPAEHRWPDVTETALKRARGQAPIETQVKTERLVINE